MGQHESKQRWLLIVRSVTIVLIGILLLSFTETSHQKSYGIGALLLLNGLCAMGYGSANWNTQKMIAWLLTGGLFDVGFGIAMLFYANGLGTNFLYVLGLWALIFAFLQAAQAMYSYIGPAGSSFDIITKIIHMLLVIMSLWLAYAVLMMLGPLNDLLGLTGIIPVFMGVLILGLVSRIPNKVVPTGQL